MVYLRAGGILGCICLTPSPVTPFPFDGTSFSPFRKSLHVLTYLLPVCHTCSMCVCGSQTTCKSQFPPLFMWVPGIKHVTGLDGSNFPC